MDKRHRFGFLDGLRGIAALVVVIFHFTEQYGHAPIFSSAALAVDLFFCLSGFVIAWSYSQRLLDGMSYWGYLKRRLIRLYPMFLIGLCVGLVSYFVKLKYGHTPYSVLQIAESNLFNVFYLPYFVSSSANITHGVFLTNPPAWSLFFEMVANVLFIFTVRFSKSKLIALTVIFSVLLIWSAYYFKIFPGWSTVNFLGGFPRVGFSFMVGLLIYNFYDHIKKLPSIHPVLIVVTLIIMFLLPFHKSVNYWLVCTSFVVPMVVILGSKVEIKRPPINNAVLFLGWISYPVYCLHNPILNIYRGFTIKPTNFYFEISILFIVTLILTYLIAKYFDDPIRAWLSKPKLSGT